jgi:hypothetical protein
VNGNFGRIYFNRIAVSAGGIGIDVTNVNSPIGSEVFHNSIYCNNNVGVRFSRGMLDYVSGNVVHRAVAGSAFGVINDTGYAPAYGFENNRLFNCSSVYSAANVPIVNANNVSLTNAPYVNPLSDDWTLSSELVGLRDEYNLTYGAVQATGGGSGATFPRIGPGGLVY